MFQTRKTHRNLLGALACALALGFAAPAAEAAPVIADFNDLSTTFSTNGPDGQLLGQGGGTGFDGDWENSNSLAVVSGNLSSNKYAITQSGTPQMVEGTFNGFRMANRDLAESMTGEVWFSFLVNTPEANSRAGFTWNTDSPTSTSGLVNFQNGSMAIRLGTSTSYATITNAIELDETTLVVGQMIIDPDGNDTLRIWIDPDLIDDPNIANHTPIFDDSTQDFIDSLDRVGIAAYRTSTTAAGGLFDHLRISDTETAFMDVTGVPEPASLVLMGMGALLALRRRRG